jgi:DNA-binding MarR family transcriptional regulator
MAAPSVQSPASATSAAPSSARDLMPAGNFELAIRLVLAMARLRRRALSQRTAAEPSLTQDSVLFSLYHNGPVTIGQLAAYEGVQPPTMTRAVALLEARGLVTRQQVSGDRRRVMLDLTPLGRERVRSGATLRARWLEAHLDTLTEHEHSILSAAADILTNIAIKEPSLPRREATQPGQGPALEDSPTAKSLSKPDA